MIRLLADENVRRAVVEGLRLRVPEVDIVRAQEVNLAGAPDEDILDWSTGNDRVVLTHDVSTLVGAALKRVAAGVFMPGVIAVSWSLGIGQTIEDLVLVAQVGREDDFQDQVRYLPF